MFAEFKSGKIKTFACPLIGEFGHFLLATSGTSALSTCSSPSIINSGCRSFAMAKASFILSMDGSWAEPFVENERKAIRGSIPNFFAVSAVSEAMSARSCEFGLIVIAASANTRMRFSSTIKKIPDTLWNFSFVFMI